MVPPYIAWYHTLPPYACISLYLLTPPYAFLHLHTLTYTSSHLLTPPYTPSHLLTLPPITPPSPAYPPTNSRIFHHRRELFASSDMAALAVRPNLAHFLAGLRLMRQDGRGHAMLFSTAGKLRISVDWRVKNFRMFECMHVEWKNCLILHTFYNIRAPLLNTFYLNLI